jgi:hypothetical protein
MDPQKFLKTQVRNKGKSKRPRDFPGALVYLFTDKEEYRLLSYFTRTLRMGVLPPLS